MLGLRGVVSLATWCSPPMSSAFMRSLTLIQTGVAREQRDWANESDSVAESVAVTTNVARYYRSDGDKLFCVTEDNSDQQLGIEDNDEQQMAHVGPGILDRL